MDESLKRRLVDLGIPAELHDARSLAELFPPGYRLGQAALEPDVLAEILAALVARGMISVRGSDARACARSAGGRHLCHFYRDEAEYVSFVSTFLAGAMPERERAIWVLPPWLGAAAAARALELAGAAPVAVELLSMGSVYFEPDGSMRQPPQIIDFWRSRIEGAQAAGLRGIRVTGDGTDLAASSIWMDAERYEHAVDQALAGPAFTALCTYSLRRVPAVRLSGTLGTHRSAFVRRGGLWDEVPPSPGSAAVLGLLQQSSR